MLLENECKQVEKNGNKVLNTTALVNRNSDYQGQEAGGCQYCHKPGHKKDLYWRKHSELIPTWTKQKRKSESTPNKLPSSSKLAIMLKNINCQA